MTPALESFLRRRPAGGPGAEKCTGLAASWCAIHGTCRCFDDDGNRPSLDRPECPLHNATSSHATGPRE